MTIRSWDDPVERSPLIERIGVKAYNVAALIVGILRPVITLALVIAGIAIVILLGHDLSS
jgi:hypothetical protein